MEHLKSYYGHLENLQREAGRLTAAGLSLITLFAEEANRLNREDEASRLQALYSYLWQQLDLVRRSEDSACYGHTKANLIVSVSGLAVSIPLAIVSKNKRLSTISSKLLDNLNNEQLPFGSVLVCIGSKGLPDDIRVVSISRLARESARQESEIINELQEHGCLLFSKEKFSLLIDRLVTDIREGRLCLPISREKLYQIAV